jgi:prephenate dehydrogenase
VRVGVVGLGLLGGSVARRLDERHELVGYDADEQTRRAAAAAGLTLVGSVEEASAGADVAIVATPLAAVATVLPALSTSDCRVVTDVVSVKRPVLAAALAAGLAGRYVGGHPMTGTEHSGFAASDPALLDGAAWVLCLEHDTPIESWLAVAELVTGAGCRVVACSAAAHDDAQARVSGLPHVLAEALATVGGGGGPLAASLAAGSFRDGTRVAGTRPELVAALCDGNRDALGGVLDEALTALGDARAALGEGRSVLPIAAAGHAAHRELTRPLTTVAERLDAAAPTIRADLLALGAAGGVVDGVDGTVLHCRRPR